MKKPEILAIIPARSGSKGILRKNIRPFNGKPLITHSIVLAKSAPSVSRVIVSTDSEEIASIAREAGAEVPFLRPAEYAGDTSKVVDAVAHLLLKLKAVEHYQPDYILLLQPTNPMRTIDDIERSVAMIQSSKADSLVSMCKVTEPLLLTKDVEDTLTFVHGELFTSTNRQEVPQYYRLDGCMIFLVNTEKFLEQRSFYAGKLIGYEIEKWRAVDIDAPEDFVVGEMLFAKRQEISRAINRFS